MGWDERLKWDTVADYVHIVVQDQQQRRMRCSKLHSKCTTHTNTTIPSYPCVKASKLTTRNHFVGKVENVAFACSLAHIVTSHQWKFWVPVLCSLCAAQRNGTKAAARQRALPASTTQCIYNLWLPVSLDENIRFHVRERKGASTRNSGITPKNHPAISVILLCPWQRKKSGKKFTK